MKLSKNSKRTIFLAIFTAISFVWAAVNYFDIPIETMVQFFLSSVAVLAVCVVLAFVLVFVIRLIKRS